MGIALTSRYKASLLWSRALALILLLMGLVRALCPVSLSAPPGRSLFVFRPTLIGHLPSCVDQCRATFRRFRALLNALRRTKFGQAAGRETLAGSDTFGMGGECSQYCATGECWVVP